MQVSFNTANGNRPQQMDPDAYAQQYADENGISLEEAKAELKAKFGDPKNKEVDNNKSEQSKNDMISYLESLGIPNEIIQRGPEAVGEYAKEHDIELPEMLSTNQTDNYTGQNQLAKLNKSRIK